MSDRIHTIDTISPATSAPAGIAGMVRRVVTDAVDLVLTWQARARSRRELASMDEHTLKDIGVTRLDVVMEVDKPFWRG